MTAATLTVTGLAFEVPAKPFADAVDWVARHLAARPAVPVLAGVMLDVADDHVTISGFDYDVATRVRIDVHDAVHGRALVSGRLLAAVTKTFSGRPVAVSVADHTMTVRCGTATLTLPLMADADYPQLPDLPARAGTMPADVFAALVERVAPAADRAATYAAALVAVHLRFDAGSVAALASDGYRIAHGQAPWGGQSGIEAQVPVSALVEGAKAVGTDGDVDIHLDGSAGMVGFAGPGRSIITRQVAEPYPAHVVTIIPQRADAPAEVPVTLLQAALRRAALVRDDKLPAVLTFSRDSLTVTATSTERSAATGEQIAIDYAGPDITIGINPGYLLDALEGVRADTAEISMTAPNKPVLLTAPDGADRYRHAIVPIRL